MARPTRADKLTHRLLSNPDCADDGTLANELLREFQRGAPLENLRVLLTSPVDKVAMAGAFILDELGAKGRPVIGDVVALLHRSNKHIRGHAIGSLLTCTTRENLKEIGAVILLLEDRDWPIRWKTMEFLSLARPEQLKAGLDYFISNNPSSEHIQCLRWLLSDHGSNAREIHSWLQSDDLLKRKYAVVAAARIVSVNRMPLEWAVCLKDEDVRRFADTMLTVALDT